MGRIGSIMTYSIERKEAILKKLLPPLNQTVAEVARAEGLSVNNIFTQEMGGCPVLNVGVDAQHNNKLLSAAAKETINTIEGKIALVLENGVNKGELKLPVPPLQFAKQLYTMLQGAVAMSTMTRDRKYLMNTVAYLEQLVKKELRN